ncbi:site-specific DNA-methyltransferase [Vandammella animalimorsus]|uniref:site-specific DNA-methyltransferase (adenine-specific) n=1 Tax=Vandammella animalimorsus TaxID=2029117 RepID=A0A2A2T543_9BURK|nr:site-specific DNA-methyltransferase [Vandammella animalimorsus]PAT30763.1 site-specific DNA-methyltransferase [Vandammella animalimorsus]PAX16578.1 site-specific DNA-methyltransferase [Vandammella animalimorsus]PAX19208.1 site-specific DNA-methyltransferase [Vandammella animalimorsus]
MARQPKSTGASQAASKASQKPPIGVEDLVHATATRKNIPTAEHQSIMDATQRAPRQARYPRANAQWLEALCALHETNGSGADEAMLPPQPRLNRELDPQLIWRGKDQQDWSDLVVNAPPLYIQEKVKPKALIDDLRRLSQTADNSAASADMQQAELFGDFNGLPEGAERTDFYQHEGHWQNRLILGDSLQVMASLAEREGLRGKVQCIYFDPPYGIKFNSNFQWSTTSRDVKDGNASHITREPEQVKAFRDTWRDGIHSYLSYLRDRLMVARDLLSDTGSIFVQIGDENVHRVRAVMDEVFGEGNFVSQIGVAKTTGSTDDYLGQTTDYLIWYAKSKRQVKFRKSLKIKKPGEKGGTNYNRLRNGFGESFSLTDELLSDERVNSGDLKIYSLDNLTSQSAGRDKGEGAASWFGVSLGGKTYKPSLTVRWKTNEEGMSRLKIAGRLEATASRIGYVRYLDDFPAVQINNRWDDVGASFMSDKIYVVQTSQSVIQRCLLMASDPGDLVLDPTCGSGTTAYVAEQWGRRWITIDTSRVALALARARIMGARYPYYLLADSREGQLKEAEISQRAPSNQPAYGNIAHGFVCQRVPHITLKAIANNAEIDVIWDQYEAALAPLRAQLTDVLPKGWLAAHRKAQKYTAEVPADIQEWEVPRDCPDSWPASARALHEAFWQQRIARQKDIDASIAAKADFETLYDKPYEDKKRVRVAGPFTVESLNPHRELGVDEEDRLIDPVEASRAEYGQDFAGLILENLRSAGVQQAHKSGKIAFTALTPWPGQMVCAEGRYDDETGASKRAGIFIGPEFGTVTRVDLADAAREAGEAGFDVLIACAFNYDAQASEFDKLGRVRVLKARMNADLHMAEDLKNTGKGNLFVIFGEPDVDVQDTQGRSIRRYDGQQDIIDLPAGEELVVKIRGVDVFDPASGEVRSDSADGIACWFLDTNYNEESFFVRHAYFLGAGDPYKALKTTLKADINPEAWASLNSDTSRPFPRPETGRFAVKVINHLGDEVMKVFKVG